MPNTKQRNDQHLIDQEGKQLLREKLPRPWVLREYRPDYGVDFAVEVFKPTEPIEGTRPTYETLGEHFFVQLKSVAAPEVRPLSVFSRENVEKVRERLNREDEVAKIETYRFSLETPELMTVERMGIGVPVLLVIADLTARRCSFVCLNDYIDKILVPRYDDYRSAQHRTVHVPVSNEIGTEVGTVALRWYAKRAKLIAAFQRFTYQFEELKSAADRNWQKLSQYFGQRIGQYDFWDDTEMCEPIRNNGEGLKRFLKDGRPNYFRLDDEVLAKLGEEEQAYLLRDDVFELWRRLALMPNLHEDIWREWFLPSALGFHTSTP